MAVPVTGTGTGTFNKMLVTGTGTGTGTGTICARTGTGDSGYEVDYPFGKQLEKIITVKASQPSEIYRFFQKFRIKKVTF